jgi:hypothetical protein
VESSLDLRILGPVEVGERRAPGVAHHIDGITSTESFFVLEVHKLAYGWGVGQVESLAPASTR